ncbi:GFA family protein [Stigmatella erecta]|uniref:Uncharacterized conserved protein n=1 Tax=Stigmatella erecta TaxID=83460 RepID=A0A1I0GUE7_9BACT|nr:aldehyde-activating protein [Stigmatella erecta]SET74038.1 Uncharacterized conserved protein [Stigmatella erecta]
MFDIQGRCHCGNIRVAIHLTRSPESYSPRACDCGFCLKHAAAYVSDPEGTVEFDVRDSLQVGRYKQGSQTAEFLFCKGCGVLVGVVYPSREGTFAAINSRIVEDARFGPETAVSPQKLSAGEKVKRWEEVWFSKVAMPALRD